MSYPADYGFIEGTMGEDGDPLDALCLVGRADVPGLPHPRARRRRLPHDRREGPGREDHLRAAQGSCLDARPRRPRHPARAPRTRSSTSSRSTRTSRRRRPRRGASATAPTPSAIVDEARAPRAARRAAARRSDAAARRSDATHGARRKKRPLRPRVPARVARSGSEAPRALSTTRTSCSGSALVALGLVLARVLWLGWDGGAVGALARRRRSTSVLGERRVRPAGRAPRPRRADARAQRPRRRAAVPARRRGRLPRPDDRCSARIRAAGSGGARRRRSRALIGETGRGDRRGRARSSAALLLVTGASAGAILRRSGHVVQRAGARRRARAFDWASSDVADRRGRRSPARAPSAPPEASLDGVEAYPDVVARRAAPDEPPPLVAEPRPSPSRDERRDRLRRPPTAQHAEYRLPDRTLLRASPAGAGRDAADASARTAELLVQTLSHFGVDATVVGPDRRPARRRATSSSSRPGRRSRRSPGSRTTSRTRSRRPRSASSRRSPASRRWASRSRTSRRDLVTLGDIYDDLPGDREPALGLARQGHLRQRGLDRPRADAAPPDRRHDGLGQVGLHQHDPHLDPAARDARRRADDPDRPEADRAQLLRVDPAPPDAGRLEPEGGGRRPHERRRRDGAPLRAALDRPRPQPARGEPRVPRARRGSRCRTCSS